MTSVKVGQVYADKDARTEGRHVRVDEVTGLYARCLPCTVSGKVMYGRSTRISLYNLEKRFRLVTDAEASPDE